ncbi:inhibitor of nuclear factor kappa-B kinase subunit epsilon [Anopheles arabiensis]|uniref:Protein kinase domain-containing protein n=2 Tax=gambiae species complex TaxID=44542 RepID=A0A182IDZ1_ANOAR|nr:inhibitor of nuclear factor kappa-B kinase subunit epsilon [Anopheles arabiensis]
MNSFLRGSMNYVWCTTSVLGKGSTGAVFQGVNKHNGEPVAVKTFNQLSHMRPQDVQMREFEVLRKVNHNNIVKLLDIEDDQEGRGKVIVMELCTGGSLFNILDDPENTYGLPQKEFLLVLEHLSAGMKHLRDNNLVHRDLKPGNIMKYISEDGQTVYKLTDFGAARELGENQQFASLYGTEEYLHPDMYERAVLRKSINRSFTANVDLWSIGVTLYHVATGNLPFRPYGGRKNKETMYHITTKKAPGVISGTQTSENGPIEWSKHLPAHCQLKEGLKQLVTPLMAGLLEESQGRMWSFDKFFLEVQNILNKTVLHIFYVNRATSIEVYLEPEQTLVHLLEHILAQTDVPQASQLLLLDNELFATKVDANTSARGYPPTDPSNPVMLFNIENYNVILPTEWDLPKFPTFPNGISVENDASLAKVACSVGHECKRRVESLSLLDTLMNKSVHQFSGFLAGFLVKLLKRTRHLEDIEGLISELTKMFEVAASNHETYQKLGATILASYETQKSDFQRVSEPIQQLYARFVKEESLVREWNSGYRALRTPNKNRDSEKAKSLVDRLRDSWQHMLRDRATRSLTYNDEQFHVLEKVKIAETGKRLKTLLNDGVRQAVEQEAECLADWYKKAQTIFLQTQFLTKDVGAYVDALYELREQLKQHREDLKEEISTDGEVSKTIAGKSIPTMTSTATTTIPIVGGGGGGGGDGGDGSDGKGLSARQNQYKVMCFMNMYNQIKEVKKMLQQNSDILAATQGLLPDVGDKAAAT